MTFRSIQTLALAATLAGAMTLVAASPAQSTSPTTPANPQTVALDLPEAPQSQLAFSIAVLEPIGQGTPAQTRTSPSDTHATDSQSSSSELLQDLTPEEKRRLAEIELERERHQRIGRIVPNFNSVIDGSPFLPLTKGQKMRAAFRSAVDPYQFALAGVTSLYGQATDSHSTIDPDGLRHGYGQGMVGYVKRYGASYADQFDGTILGNGVFPALFHQDARYFRLGTGSIKRRILYSAGTTIRCKGDNGKWQPSYSNLLGNMASGGISNIYYPAADRGFELTIQQGVLVTLEGTFGALLIEFYPDIQKHFHKNRDAQSAGSMPGRVAP